MWLDNTSSYADVRKWFDELKLHQGQRLEFRLDRNGRLILEPLIQDVRKLKGIVHSRRKRSPSLDEIAKAIARGYSR